MLSAAVSTSVGKGRGSDAEFTVAVRGERTMDCDLESQLLPLQFKFLDYKTIPVKDCLTL